jgi:AraC-like DNA-binding protein
MLPVGQRLIGPSLPLPAPSSAGVSTCTLPETVLATPAPAPQRLPYHLLALTTAGHGTVEVDFAAQPSRPGTLLWVRPGQALRFSGAMDATLVAWERDLLRADDLAGFGIDDPVGPSRWQLAGEDEDAIISEVTQLAVDCDRHSAGRMVAALLHHQLAVLLLRIALLTPPGPGEDGPATAETRTFARFRRQLEDGHARSRRVEDYAARLGCSVRTLTRASLAITGRTAKQVVDDRVALEARRLLACTDLSVAEIGRQLGFGEPTNFGRFFHREVGTSPGAFRAGAGNGTESHVPMQRSSAD